MNTIWPASVVRMPRTLLRVVCGTGETIDTFPPHRALTSVDFPDEGRPTIAMTAAFTFSSRKELPHAGELVVYVAEDPDQDGIHGAS
jgi:hypothetical protein